MIKHNWRRSGPISAAITLLIIALLSFWACGPRETTIELEFHEGTDMEAVPSPDGRQMALQLWSHIWILDIDSGEARPLTDPITPPDEHWFPRWSPDGNLIVFYSLRTDAGLFVISASGGQPRKLTDGELDFWPSWSPDGKTIVFERLGSLWTIPAEGGTPKRLTPDNLNAQQPAWSPDGKWIAFSSNDKLSIISPDGSSLQNVTSGKNDNAPSWSPDSKNLFFISSRSVLPQVWSVSLEGGEPRKLTEESDLCMFAPQWMPGHDVLVYTAGGKIHSLNPTSGAQDIIPFRARLTISRQSYKPRGPKIPLPGERLPVRGIYRPTPSPDGDRIAFAALGDLWLRHEDGRVEQLTSGPADDCDPSWSPDGKSITFVSNKDGDYQLWVLNIEDRMLRQVTELDGDAETPIWHPSGESIVFKHRFIKIVPATGGTAEPVVKTPGDMRPLGWLPDDQSLVYSRLYYDSKSYETKTTIQRVSLNGTQLPLEADPADQAEFFALSPQGDILAFVSNGELFIRPLKEDETWRPLISGPVFFPAWSADRKLMFVSSGKLMSVDSETGEMRNLHLDLSYEVAKAEGSLLLKNARLLTPEPLDGLWDLFIENGRIQSIESSGSHHRTADRELDVEGRTVIPGLFDTHVHIFRRFPAEGYLYWGVTSVGGAGGEGHWIVMQQEAIRSGRRAGPRIFPACGFVVPNWMNAYPQFLRVKTQDQIEQYMDHLSGLGATQVKSFLRRAPWIEAAAIKAAHRHGLPVMSHFIRPASVVAGLDRKEHSFYYIWDGSANARFRQDVIEICQKTNITVSTTLTFPFIWTKQGRARATDVLSRSEVSNFLPPAQLKRLGMLIKTPVSKDMDIEYSHMLEASKANAIDAHNAGIRVIVGTDFAPFLGFVGVHWEMEFLVDAGFSPLEALRAATKDAAEALSLDGQLGIIVPGAIADLVVLEADPLEDIRNTQKIHSIIKDGSIIDRNALIKER